MGKNNHQHKDLIENMPTAFAYHKVIYDENNKPIDYVFLKINNKFEEVTGLKREDVIDKKATNVLYNITNNSFDWIQFYGKIALIEKSVKFQEYSEPLGRWYEVKAYSQETGYFTTIFNDITEKKIKERKLKEKTNRLNNIFNNLDDIIWSISWPSLQVQFISRAVKDIVGYTIEEFKEDPQLLKKITHPEDKNINEKSLKRLEEEGYTEREFRVICKNGSIKWLYDKGKMVYDENDNPVRVEGVMRDITERKETKTKLKYSREMYETIFNSAPLGIIIENEKGDIIKVNEEMSKISGYGQDELENSNIINKLVLPKYKELAKENIKRIINGENLEYDIETPMKSGDMNYYHLKETNIDLPSGKKGIISMHMDVTERKIRTKELKFEHDFQKMLADISSKLVGINNANFDSKINNSLKKIGQFFEIDRSYLFQLSDNKKYVTNTHEWTVEEVQSGKENLSVERLPWLMRKLYNKEIINVFNVEQLGKKAKSERNIFQEENVKSIVIIPIFIKGKLSGFFGFDSVKEKRHFNQEKINKIKIITDVITSALLQYLNIKRIEKLTYKDSLTGLYNRRYFEEEMERLDTKRQLPISIIMADINGLKIINDSYGHETGDQMLIETGNILKEELRNEDILARHGGDEFTVLLPQTSKTKAKKIVSRLKNENHKVSEEGITLSCSLGIATKANEDQNISEVLKEADDDMYRNKLSESRSTKNKIVQSLLNTLEAKSSETKEHAIRMTKLVQNLGKKIGLSISKLNKLSILATLHDIGKTTISEDILTKSGRLTKKEWEIIKEHPERGYKIASASEEFIVVAEEILYHHEHWDGSGYPDCLKGEEIPYLARIISVIDAYDVMTNKRAYSKAISTEEALAEIKRCAGSQFDPALVEKFIELKKCKN